MSERFLVIAAGGTGGHMFPAQALAQEMLRRGWAVALSTDERGMRYAGGYPEQVERRALHAASFSRGGLGAKLAAPVRILRGAGEARAWFRERRPALVAGFGGYPSLPALLAAWRMGVPRIIHEQNGVLGQVNKLFAGRVSALACGVEPVVNLPAGVRTVHVGNPIRDAARAKAGAPYAPPEPGGQVRLLVVGGSQGARALAERVPAAVALLPEDLRRRLAVIQQTRDESLDAARRAYDGAGVEAVLAPFFDDMPQCMADSHLVISRAGASTIAELTAIGRPSVLAPLPSAAADHQSANARSLSEPGAALLAPEAALTPESLAGTLAALLADPDRLSAMAAAALSLGRPDAARDLADLVERVAAG